MAFVTALTPVPAAGKAIPYTWFTSLLDNTLALRGGLWSQVDITTTGTVNNHAPAAGTMVRCNNASALIITGIVPTADGEVRVYVNVGTSTVRITHEDAGSTAANRVTCPSTRGQIVGANGAIGLQYDATSDRWRILFAHPGAPISIVFSAGDFTADTGAHWTVASGDVLVQRYQQQPDGKTVRLKLTVIDSDIVTGTPAYLKFTLPNGFVVGFRGDDATAVRSNGTYAGGIVVSVSGESFVRFYRIDIGTTWAISSANNDVRCTVDLEVQ